MTYSIQAKCMNRHDKAMLERKLIKLIINVKIYRNWTKCNNNVS
jgi:hypothetical protein